MHEPVTHRSNTDRDQTSRRDFLRFSTAGIAGVTLLGVLPGTALAQERAQGGKPERSSEQGGPPEDSRGALMREFREAAREYDLPVGILVAMGYVNTRLKMPEPEANDYEEGDLHGWGSYGIMALVKNPSSNTLGEASEITGIPEEELKRDRRANILGGAALLAESRGEDKPAQPRQLLGATAGKGPGRSYDAVAGVGAGELYAEQLEEVLQNGFSEKVDGEKIALQKGEVVF